MLGERGGGSIGVDYPQGDIGDDVNASILLRKGTDGFGLCGAGICGEAHHLFPSSRMAQT